MKVVIDTNLLLVIIPEWSMDYDIYLCLLDGQFDFCVSTDILLEYEEILSTRYGTEAVSAVLEILLSLPNIHFIENYFFWNLITADPDDNKFSDCAVNAGCKYLVSDDKHFKVLQQIDFPKVKVIGKTKFREILGLPTANL